MHRQDPRGSGNARCEITMSHGNGQPHYHVAEPTGDVYLARLLSCPQPLSVETLQDVWDALETQGVLDEELGACFERALAEFPREPPCVQNNAEMVIQSDEMELTFLSGKGKCKIRISDNGTCYEVKEPTARVYLARLKSRPQKLSTKSLQGVRDALEKWALLDEELGACFERALAEFPREPPCVQNNAEMVIQSDEMELTFLSGKGKCKIRISDNGTCYEVKEPTARVYLARLKSRPQKLSTKSLQGVRDALEKWALLDEELGACFERALAEFPREPRCVKRNARMVIRHETIELVFVSGQGECEITVSEGDREPGYKVKEPTVTVYQERLRSRPQRLSVGNLERIRHRLESWEVMTKELRCCFDLVLREFPKEPECVRENPGMCVVWDETKLRLVSEDGDCEVSVTCCDGKPSYEVKVKSWVMYRERMRLSEQPLSTENLQSMRGEVRGLSGVPEKVKEALNVAVRDFSAEPGCLQENARLVIECDRGEMVFVSGKGENKVDVCIIDGKVSYSVAATKWVAFLRVFLKLLPKMPDCLLKLMPGLAQFLLMLLG
ncbi:uncharacterized protein LOC116821074 [Chelonoidis abingdonii]|uniref:uncharacterized protein LOC116821074 n=1 Tax=Chelonoidis abingdonii TaxID=106734 RepID=UPI0013F18DB5|nr:uncharacterized protein LOC116821074 [Chelonoidis abingdonii]